MDYILGLSFTLFGRSSYLNPHIFSCGKRDFVDVIKLNIQNERIILYYSGKPNRMTRVFIVKGQRSKLRNTNVKVEQSLKP